MARASTSLDLSEFFSNDDSDGHRLANFLQKRRGVVQKPNFVLMNCEPQRLSFNVQLEKLPTTQEKPTTSENNGPKKETKGNVETGSNILQETLVDPVAALDDETVKGVPNNLPNDIIPTAASCVQTQYRHISPVLRPSPSVLNLLSPPPLSPRSEAIRKSGGTVALSDRLRRYSLKRLTNMCTGRRTLLQEFESTVSEAKFDPPVFSTPILQEMDKTEKTIVPSTSSPPTDAENFEPKINNTEKISTVNESCCGHTDTLIRTLQRKDEELKNYMESITESMLKKMHEKENYKTGNERTTNATMSPLKRTYTVEKGDLPRQVILTPDKRTTGNGSQNSKLMQSRVQHSTNDILKKSGRSRNRSMVSIRIQSPHHQSNTPSPNANRTNPLPSEAKMLDISRSQSKSQQAITVAVSEVPNTPPLPDNISIALPDQHLEIPETQEQPIPSENSITIQASNHGSPVVVIPVSQIFKKNCSEDHLMKNNTIKSTKPQTSINVVVEKESQQTPENGEKLHDQLAEDNLKLTDILTDDEEEQFKAAASQSRVNNSQEPLNLASSTTNGRVKHLRKRSITQRRLQVENSRLLTTETETEQSSQERTTRRSKRKPMPLNRAPGPPLNGEKFAAELARMSNCEILDLRKRNSMGRVFAISRRRSKRLYEDAVKKQHELNDQIEMELLRRNCDIETYEQEGNTNQAKVVDDPEDAYPPVPIEFRDQLLQITNKSSRESSLIDEKQSDRVCFKSKPVTSQLQWRPRGKQKKPLPEVLEQYLNVSKKLLEKNKNAINSKRSLYAQDNNSHSEDNIKSNDNISEQNQTIASFRDRKQSIPCVPSPPKSYVDQITHLKVVSPPPPLNTSPRKSPIQQEQQSRQDYENLEEHEFGKLLPPPPPGFETDSGVSSTTYNNNTIQATHSLDIRNSKKTTTHLNTTTATTTVTNSDTDTNDEEIFKKPQTPLPRRTLQKNKVDKSFSNKSQISNNNSSSNSSGSTNTINVSTTTTITTTTNPGTNTNDEEIFKKPQAPPPRRNTRKIRVDKSLSNQSQVSTRNCSSNSSDSANTMNNSTVRRSQRSKEHITKAIPISQRLFEENFTKRLKLAEKRYKDEKKLRQKSKRSESSKISAKNKQSITKHTQLTSIPEDEVLVSATLQDDEILQNKNKPKTKGRKGRPKKRKNDIQTNDNFECSHLILNAPPPVDHLNNIFDQLRNSSSQHVTSNTQPAAATAEPPPGKLIEKVKPFKVRVARLKSTIKPSGSEMQCATDNCLNTGSTTTSSVASSFNMRKNINSNYELISWLKNISEPNSSSPSTEDIFKEMRISAASNLSFTELQGIEYAFYDTEEKACLGYLRFKPRQMKPKKKPKRYHLHFVALVGKFLVKVSDKVSSIGVGDMVAIEKSVYYEIENITDDIGILMVIKK